MVTPDGTSSLFNYTRTIRAYSLPKEKWLAMTNLESIWFKNQAILTRKLCISYSTQRQLRVTKIVTWYPLQN